MGKALWQLRRLDGGGGSGGGCIIVLDTRDI
jgi:hypothetical protein